MVRRTGGRPTRRTSAQDGASAVLSLERDWEELASTQPDGRYQTPTQTMSAILDEFLKSARVGVREDEPDDARGRITLRESASPEARRAVDVVAGRRQVSPGDAARDVWLALFALDDKVEYPNDPRAAAVLTREVGFGTFAGGNLVRRGRKILPLEWDKIDRLLFRAYEQMAYLEGMLMYAPMMKRRDERRALLADAREALGQYGAWFRALAPPSERGAPRRTAHELVQWKAAVIIAVLAEESFSAGALRELVLNSNGDWSPAPITAGRLRQLRRPGRVLRDHLTALRRAGERELVRPRTSPETK